jgi:hypothetical protein
MFQQINISDLCYNQKYKIVCYDETYTGFYKGKCWIDKTYLEFVNVRKLSIIYSHRYFSHTREFYRIVSKKTKIQSDMEHRAVNLIISSIIGDTHFIW